jgi:lipopolysaccharide export LptBFGC system permease protein LptF
MASLLLLSVLAATVLMPSFASRDPDPARGLRRLLIGIVAFGFLYWLVVMFVTPAA